MNNTSSIYASWVLPEGPAFNMGLTVVFCVLGLLIGLACILGNAMVLLSFYLERRLRHASNYFIASLAFSDILIGAVSIPLFLVCFVMYQYWPLADWLCKTWLTIDYTVCLSSQYTVFFITVDRFCLVRIPATYRTWRTDNKIRIMVVCCWLLPSVLFFSAILAWPAPPYDGPPKCEVPWTANVVFNTALVIGYYWVTLTVMIVLYAAIYRVALQMQRKSDHKNKRLKAAMSMANSAMREMSVAVAMNLKSEASSKTAKTQDAGVTDPLVEQSNSPNGYGSVGSDCEEHAEANHGNLSSPGSSAGDSHSSSEPSDVNEPLMIYVTKPTSVGIPPGVSQDDMTGTRNVTLLRNLMKPYRRARTDTSLLSPVGSQANLNENGRKQNGSQAKETTVTVQDKQVECQVKESKPVNIETFRKAVVKFKAKRLAKKDSTKPSNRARKALRTITFILGAFVLCWTPYHVLALLIGFGVNVNTHLYTASYWLCYMNSPLNPFCYALANQQFKTTFIRILKLDFRKK